MQTIYEYLQPIKVTLGVIMHTSIRWLLDTEPPTLSNSKTYYNVSVSSDGHVVLTPKLMALGNTIHCVQTTSVINRQVHRLRSHCWISIPVPWYRTLKLDPRYNCLCSQTSFDLFCRGETQWNCPFLNWIMMCTCLQCTWQISCITWCVIVPYCV